MMFPANVEACQKFAGPTGGLILGLTEDGWRWQVLRDSTGLFPSGPLGTTNPGPT